ncbi:hypothetical protein JCM30237_22100 [Halolamina litorea]|uniref:PKD domain-containing protein n=1 Tax=Halolamina litorea TaxID=1515593 RepID=A0ABD6BUE1_9EURY|nr:PKD domain-containing protein [Halolamina litorea]
MTPSVRKHLRQTTAALAALLLVLSVLGPVGTVAAQPSVTVTQSADSTTVTPGDTVTLTADFVVSELNAPQLSATTPDGWEIESQSADGPVAYNDGTWTWLAGDEDGVNVSYTVEYTVSVPDDAEPGQYTIGLEGSALSPDDTETTDSASTTVTVEEPDTNSPPTADAGTDQTVNESTSVSLDASGSSDPDGDSLSYSWTQTGGPDVTLSDASTATPSFTAPAVDADDTLTFEVTVSDGEASDSDTVTVAVQNVPDEPENVAPTADAGADQTVDESTTVVLSGDASSDADGTIESYAWTQTGGPDVTLSDASSATPEFTAPDVDAETALTFELAVTDDDGATSTDTTTVTVQDTDTEEPPALETSVSLSPVDGETSVGGTTTFDLVIDSADGGVGAYSATVSLDDASVGSITNVDLLGSPAGQTTDIDIAADGSSVSIDAALMNTSDTGSVTVATVTVQGVSAGSTDLSTTVDALGNEQGASYTVTDTSGASLTVTEKSTSLSLSPTSDEISVDDTTTYDLVVDTADGGVGAYTATVSLDDASVAAITGVDLEGNPAEQTTNVDIAADGSSVTIDAALMDTADTGSVVIATITVEAENAGSTDLSVAASALGDEDGNNYGITGTNGASLTVTEVTVGDFANPVTDTDGDGQYEDINGDGTLDIVDVQALFANLDDDAVENNVEKFDFNDDGTVDIVDVQALFYELVSAS